MSARQQQKADTRAKILTAAQTTFKARGYGAVTCRDLSAEADVSVATIFKHFKSKDDLYVKAMGHNPPDPVGFLREVLDDLPNDTRREAEMVLADYEGIS